MAVFVLALVPVLSAQPVISQPVVAEQPDARLYWYNPDADIYYDPAEGLYYWYENGQWISDSYPPDVYIDPDQWVMFSSNASAPYVMNDQIVRYYDNSGYFPSYGSDILIFNIGVAPFIEHDFFHHHRFFDHDEEEMFRHGDRDRHDEMYHNRFGHHFDPRADFREHHDFSQTERSHAGERGVRSENNIVGSEGDRNAQRTEMHRSATGHDAGRDISTRGIPNENIRRQNVPSQRENVRRGNTGDNTRIRGEQPAPRNGEMRGTHSESQAINRGGETRGCAMEEEAEPKAAELE